jgi:hypothetical protein
MFIQTENTPNPDSLKFVPDGALASTRVQRTSTKERPHSHVRDHTGSVVLESGTMDFPDARSSMTSPLAKSLFTVTGVQRVFFGHDFITVTKKPDIEWHEIKVHRPFLYTRTPYTHVFCSAR